MCLYMASRIVEKKRGTHIMLKNRTERYICTIINDENAEEKIKQIKEIYGYILLRGRHKNRKMIMNENGLEPNFTNDIPWRLSERIDIYRR